jgi:GAF domain-containing protein
MSESIQNRLVKEDLSQEVWKEKFLQRILILTAIVGLFVLIPAVFGTTDLVLQSVYVGVFVFLVVMTLTPLPYIVKAIGFVLLPLILGFASLSETGIRGDSLFFFLAFVTYSSLLIGSRAGIASITITEFIIIGMGYLILNDYITLTDTEAFAGDLLDWETAALSQLLISMVIMSALRMLNENFEKTHQRAITMQQSQFVSQKELEARIAERTQQLSRRTEILEATSFVTHQTAILQNLDKLLDRVVVLISEHFWCYHAGIYLINQRGDYLTLQAASSDGGKRLMERGFRIRFGMEGMIGFVAAEKKPRFSGDISNDAVFISNPELAETRSELSLPLIVQNKIIGVLDMQSTEANVFKHDEIEILQVMADQIAVAIEHARSFAESNLTISQLEVISNEKTRQNWKNELTNRKPMYRYSASGVTPIEKPVLPQGKNVLDIPIVLRGEKIGNISLKRKAEFQKWTSQEEAIASEVAAQTALALENIRLVERTQERAVREQAISNVSARIRETLDLDIVLRTSAREIQKVLNLQEAEIRLIPQNGLDSEESQVEVPLS